MWHHLTTEADLTRLLDESKSKPCVIFKHSTRCSISTVALRRVERAAESDDTPFEWYYLDVLEHRVMSHRVSEQFAEPHQSPQVLLIKDGVCVFEASHLGITVADLYEALEHDTLR